MTRRYHHVFFMALALFWAITTVVSAVSAVFFWWVGDRGFGWDRQDL